MKIFNPYPDRDEGIKRMVESMIEIDTCYKRGFDEKGLGAVIIHRSWRIDHNPFDGWHRCQRITYQTIQQLKRFKSVPIDVTGIDESDSTSLKNQNLINLINKYGTEKVISVELALDPFWFIEPIHPSWRFFRVLLQSWERPNAEVMTKVFKLLANAVKL